MEYTEWDVDDVLLMQRVDTWIWNATAGNLGEEAAANPTPEAALRDMARDAGERLSAQQLADDLARYNRGRELSRQFVLVDSGNQVEATPRAEAFFREHKGVAGRVVWRNAGYIATSPRYVCYGLRPR